jgi:hypothetical protein
MGPFLSGLGRGSVSRMAGGNGPEDFCSVLIILSPVLAQQSNVHLTNAVYPI